MARLWSGWSSPGADGPPLELMEFPGRRWPAFGTDGALRAQMELPGCRCPAFGTDGAPGRRWPVPGKFDFSKFNVKIKLIKKSEKIMSENQFLKLQNGSDIRGVAVDGVPGENVNLTGDIAEKIAGSFVLWLSKKSGKSPSQLKVGVGRDSRITGPDLAKAVISGIESAGASCINCHLATTPAMFMSIVFSETNYDGSIMITASHLPFNRNGLKFFDKDGGLEHEDIRAILEGAENYQIPDGKKTSGSESSFDLLTLYSNHLVKTISKALDSTPEDKPLSGLHIVVDAGNGAGGFYAQKVLAPLGADTSGSQFLDPDGMFPNHIPNPENKEAMASIQKAVLENKADLGLIFDTDVDRMSAVFPDGSEVNRDAIIALIAAILAPDYPGSTIITDSVTSDRLTAFLEKDLGLHHHCFKRGYKNVINECKRLNAEGTVSPLAMETSGHGALKDNFFLDDGAFLAVKIVIALAKAKNEGKNLASLIEKLAPLVEEKEVRFKISGEDFSAYGDQVLESFKKRSEEKGLKMPKSYEGVRISFDGKNGGDMKGWLLLRKSLHDPVMPLNIEGERPGDGDKIFQMAQELLQGFDRLSL